MAGSCALDGKRRGTDLTSVGRRCLCYEFMIAHCERLHVVIVPSDHQGYPYIEGTESPLDPTKVLKSDTKTWNKINGVITDNVCFSPSSTRVLSSSPFVGPTSTAR